MTGKPASTPSCDARLEVTIKQTTHAMRCFWAPHSGTRHKTEQGSEWQATAASVQVRTWQDGDLCTDCEDGEHWACDQTSRRATGVCGCTSSRHETAANPDPGASS